MGRKFHNFCPFSQSSTHEINVSADFQKLIPFEIGKNADLRKLYCKIPLKFGKDMYILLQKKIRKSLYFRSFSTVCYLICKFWIRDL